MVLLFNASGKQYTMAHTDAGQSVKQNINTILQANLAVPYQNKNKKWSSVRLYVMRSVLLLSSSDHTPATDLTTAVVPACWETVPGLCGFLKPALSSWSFQASYHYHTPKGNVTARSRNAVMARGQVRWGKSGGWLRLAHKVQSSLNGTANNAVG